MDDYIVTNLAPRLDRITEAFDPYGYRDSDCSVESAAYAIRHKPIDVIEWLMDMIEEYTEGGI